MPSYNQIECTISPLWETSRGALKYKSISHTLVRDISARKVDTDFPKRYLNSGQRMVHT